MSKFLHAGVLAGLVMGMGACNAQASAAPAPTQAPPVARSAAATVGAIAGERVVVAGKAPGKTKRKVVVQRKQGKRWVRAAATRTTKKGRYAVRVRVASRSVTYRAYAPRVRKHGKTLRAWRSSTTTVRPVAQRVTLTMPATASSGTTVRAAVTVRPVRPGRGVLVQQRVGGAWRTVGTGTQNAAGTAVVTVKTGTAGSVPYRAVVVARSGAAAAASSTRTVTVAAPTGGKVAFRVQSFGGEDVTHAKQMRICTTGIGGTRRVKLASKAPETGRPAWVGTVDGAGNQEIQVWPEGDARMVTDLAGCEKPLVGAEKPCAKTYQDPNLSGNWGVHVVIRIPRGASTATVMFFPQGASVGYQGAGDSLCNVEEIQAPDYVPDGLRTKKVPLSTLLSGRAIDLTSSGDTAWTKDLMGRPAELKTGWSYRIRVQRVNLDGSAVR